MKKTFSIFLVVLISIIVTLFVLFSLYKSRVVNKLNQESNNISLTWNDIYSKNLQRTLDIEKLIQNEPKECDFQELKEYILENKVKRDSVSVENLWLIEYNVNEEYVTILDCLKEDKQLLDQIYYLESNADELNKIVDKYNGMVEDFNVYRSTFPNFLFAKGEQLKRKKFFHLQYGKSNLEYYEEKKKTENWINTGKWE